MIEYEYAIYQKGRFCLELVAVWGVDKADKTISKALTNRDQVTDKAIKDDWLMKPILTQHQAIKNDCLVKPKVFANK